MKSTSRPTKRGPRKDAGLTKSDIKRAAHLAVLALFRKFDGSVATRLLLIDDLPNGKTRDHGGWALSAARDRIELALTEGFKRRPRR